MSYGEYDMGKKKKNNVFFRVFIILAILLFFLFPFTSSPPKLSEKGNLIRVSDKEVIGWIDVLPKETEGLRFFVNQATLTKIETSKIPMFPYENPFFFLLVDSTYAKDSFIKESFRLYLRNKKYDLFEFESDWSEALSKVSKKADLISDPCIIILVGTSPKATNTLTSTVFKHPLFLWTPLENDEKLELVSRVVKSTGGEAYSLDDASSLEKMDIRIHSPIQHQRILFKAKIPFFQRFYPSKLIVQNQYFVTTFPLYPTIHSINQVRWFYRMLYFPFIIFSLLVVFLLFQKSRKIWKKRKKKRDAKKALKQYRIAWIEEETKRIASQRITKSPYVIGCSSLCDFVIDADASISAKHCQIVESKGAFYLFDMLSRNGTFVNNNRINQIKLKSNDRLQIGGTILLFHQSSLQYTSDEKIL